MMALDPIRLSRELGRVEAAAVAWRQRLRQNPRADDDPFIGDRHLLDKAQLDRLKQLPQDDALRAPLMRWTVHLMHERVHHAWLTLSHQRRYGERYPVTQPVRESQTLAEIVHQLLSDAPERKPPWVASLAEHAPRVFEAETMLWQRRVEMNRRLELGHPDTIEAPTDDTEAIAEATLAATEDLLDDTLRDDTLRAGQLNWLQAVMAPLPGLRFPAHLNERAISGWFRQTRLLEDLHIAAWPLPAPLAPASFVRALDQLGEAIRRAAAPAQQPFVVARDPLGLDEARYGFALAQLPLTGAFLQQQLDCARNQVRDVRRQLARIYLLELRTRALKVLLRRAALEGASSWQEQQQELTSRAYGRELPAATVGVLPRLAPRDPQRLVGALMGATLHHRLREAHDEDWYRNPRAIDQLRSEAALPPETHANPSDVQQALSAYREQLAEWLA